MLNFFKEKNISAEKKPNYLPFKLGERVFIPNQETGLHNSGLYRSEKNPNILIKPVSIRNFDGVYSNYDEEGFRLHYQQSLAEAKKYLGKYIPEIMLVFGQDENGGATGFMISEEIIPPSELSEQEKIERAEQYDDLLCLIIKMWEDNDERVVDFDGIGNIRYGHTKNNPKNQPYLLDIYPILENVTPQTLRYKVNDFWEMQPDLAFSRAQKELLRLDSSH